MQKFWRGFVNTIFWSYERGSWPYDVMVIIIVIFVLLSPRRWFQDQSQSISLASSDIQLVQEDPERQTRTYRLDAHALPVQKPAATLTPFQTKNAQHIPHRNSNKKLTTSSVAPWTTSKATHSRFSESIRFAPV